MAKMKEINPAFQFHSLIMEIVLLLVLPLVKILKGMFAFMNFQLALGFNLVMISSGWR